MYHVHIEKKMKYTWEHGKNSCNFDIGVVCNTYLFLYCFQLYCDVVIDL